MRRFGRTGATSRTCPAAQDQGSTVRQYQKTLAQSVSNRLPWGPKRAKSHRAGKVGGVALHQGEAVAPCGRIEGNTSVSGTRPAARRLNLVTANSPLPAGNAEDRAWVSEGLCRDKDPDELFVRGAAQRKAAIICRHCPVMQQCASDALDNKVEYGVWGGMTERQRRALLKENPEVVSWSDYFDKRKIRSIG